MCVCVSVHLRAKIEYDDGVPGSPLRLLPHVVRSQITRFNNDVSFYTVGFELLATLQQPFFATPTGTTAV